jgi:hypothetical protein
VPSLEGRAGFWDTIKGWGVGMCQVREVHTESVVLIQMRVERWACARCVKCTLNLGGQQLGGVDRIGGDG